MAGEAQAALAVRDSASGTLNATFTLANLPHAPDAQVQLRGVLAGQPVTLQAQVQLHPGQDVHILLPHADWQSLHAEGDLTVAQDTDRSRGQLRWSFANLADLNALLGQHLGGGIGGELHLGSAEQPAGQY